MVRSKTSPSTTTAASRQRLGYVSVYEHHGAWWIYARVSGRSIRRRIGPRAAAQCAASLLNARLVAEDAGLSAEAIGEQLGGLLGAWRPGQAVPAGSSSEPSIEPAELRRRFIEHHEQVLGSALTTVRRYATATQHL
ncbi:MAG: hypothetical protein ACOC9P_01225, partial [bacterium]